MRVTAQILKDNGWHTVTYRHTKTPMWCRGNIKGAYFFNDAVKIFKQGNKQ